MVLCYLTIPYLPSVIHYYQRSSILAIHRQLRADGCIMPRLMYKENTPMSSLCVRNILQTAKRTFCCEDFPLLNKIDYNKVNFVCW